MFYKSSEYFVFYVILCVLCYFRFSRQFSFHLFAAVTSWVSTTSGFGDIFLQENGSCRAHSAFWSEDKVIVSDTLAVGSVSDTIGSVHEDLSVLCGTPDTAIVGA